VAGWGKVVAGAVIGVVGTVYATNEELRKNLPKAARDLPDNVRRRFERAVSAGREASLRRREEILRDLEAHGGGNHAARGVEPDPASEPETAEPEMAGPAAADPAAVAPVVAEPAAPETAEPAASADPDATRPLPRADA
jgi:hypothetical protein